jgi:hypothetical protein
MYNGLYRLLCSKNKKNGGNEEMKQTQELFSNEIRLEDKRSMILKYLLIEKYMDSNQSEPLYGIQISKELEQTVETEEVSAISYSKETVVKLMKKLFQYEVTPISMIEIVDDLVTMGI